MKFVVQIRGDKGFTTFTEYDEIPKVGDNIDVPTEGNHSIVKVKVIKYLNAPNKNNLGVEGLIEAEL